MPTLINAKYYYYYGDLAKYNYFNKLYPLIGGWMRFV